MGSGKCVCCNKNTNKSYSSFRLCPPCKKRYLDDWGPIPMFINKGVDQGTVDFWKRWYSAKDIYT